MIKESIIVEYVKAFYNRSLIKNPCNICNDNRQSMIFHGSVYIFSNSLMCNHSYPCSRLMNLHSIHLDTDFHYVKFDKHKIQVELNNIQCVLQRKGMGLYLRRYLIMKFIFKN